MCSAAHAFGNCDRGENVIRVRSLRTPFWDGNQLPKEPSTVNGARRSPSSHVFDTVARAHEGGRTQGDGGRRAARRAGPRRDREARRASASRSSAAPGAAAGFRRRRLRRGRRRARRRRLGRRRRAWSRSRSPPRPRRQRLRAGQLLISFLQPLTDRARVERLAAAGVLGFAMESIPRTTRAQSMDALSSQATVSGYKAVLLAAEHLPRFFPMLTTAAGTIAPARALVLGAGVAGLQAIATARRLGAVVVGLRRPAGRARAGAVARRDLPRPRRRRRGDRGRLRARADAGGAGAPAGGARASGSPTSTS